MPAHCTRARNHRGRLAALLFGLAAGCAKVEAEWRDELVHPDPFVRHVAAIALSAEAPTRARDAVAPLLEALELGDRSLAAPARAALARIAAHDAEALLRGLQSGREASPSRRQRSLEALRAAGPAHIPAVVAAMRAPGAASAHEIGLCLVDMGAPAVPVLAALLADPDARLGRTSAWLLGRMGPLALDARPALVRALREGAPHLAAIAAESLQRVDPRGDLVLSDLADALASSTDLVREGAARAIARVHLERGFAEPGPQRELSRRRILWLGALGLPALIEACAEPESERARFAAECLRATLVASSWGRPRGAGARPLPTSEAAVYGALGHDQASARGAILLDLARHGRDAIRFLPLLFTAADDPHPGVRLCARWAIQRVAFDAAADYAAPRPGLHPR